MRFLTIALIILMLSACQQEFNKKHWMDDDGLGLYPYRDKMLKDLLENHKLVGLNYNQLVEFIGSPQFIEKEDGIIGYEIAVDYGWDIDPVYTKTLHFTLSEDSIITDYRISEWKK